MTPHELEVLTSLGFTRDTGVWATDVFYNKNYYPPDNCWVALWFRDGKKVKMFKCGNSSKLPSDLEVLRKEGIIE